MVAHIDELEPGLRLVEREGPTDQEHNWEVLLEPDLLAVARHGNYVVIGVDAELATVTTLEHVLRHIGRVRRQLAGDGPVRGIVIAYQFEESLEYAVNALPNVKCAQYNNDRGFRDPWD